MKNYKKIILNLSLLLVASYSFGADLNFDLDVRTLDLDISTFDLDIPTLDLDTPIDLVSEPMPELVTEQVPEQATNFVDNFANGESALDPLTYPESDLPDPDQLDPAAKYSLFTMFEEEAVNDGLSLLDDAASSENAFDQSRLEEDFTPLTKKALPADKSAHKGKRQHACNHEGCKHVAASSAGLVIHMRTHTGEKPYKCNECSYSAAQSGTLKAHMRTHADEKPYKCKEEGCNYAAKSSNTLANHRKKHHKKETESKITAACSESGLPGFAQLNVAAALGSYVEAAHDVLSLASTFEQGQLGADFEQLTQKALPVPEEMHTGKKLLQCDVEGCKHIAAHLSHLVIHMRTHTGEKPYKCEICSYSTVLSTLLSTHMRTHADEKPYKCGVPGCDYEASHLISLELHGKSYHKKETESKTTAIWSESGLPGFAQLNVAAALGSYVEAAHDVLSSASTFEQGQLGADFGQLTQEALSVPEEMHTGKKQHACNFKGCKHIAARLSNLVIHMRTHTGEKPYKCNECSYSAARLHDLKIHKIRHIGEKPYKCEICSYSTAVSTNLNRHMRTHAGVKPYKCKEEGCNYAAKSSDTLVQHRKKHHKKEIESKTTAICSESGLPGFAQLNVAAALGSYVEAAGDVLSSASTFEQGQLGADFGQLTQKALPVDKEMHTGKKLLQCDVVGCSYTTVQPKRFANHKTTHEQAQNSLAGKRPADNGDENPAKRVCQEPLM